MTSANFYYMSLNNVWKGGGGYNAASVLFKGIILQACASLQYESVAKGKVESLSSSLLFQLKL